MKNLALISILLLSYFIDSYFSVSDRYDFNAGLNFKIPMRAYPTRYYVEKNTATCKSFTYRGAGGMNLNNFASLEECEKSFILDPIDRISSCSRAPTAALQNDGDNDFNVCGKLPVDRWYYQQPAAGVAQGTCAKYSYKGCNEPTYSFLTEKQCKDSCITTAEGHAIPNEADCEAGPILTGKMSIPEKEIKIVRDRDMSYCVHAIVDKVATGQRGVFSSFTQCQTTCHKNAAESKRCTSSPFQPKCGGEITTKYFFDNSSKRCRQMLAGDCKVSANDNYFDTAGECISACPALNESQREEDLLSLSSVCDKALAEGGGDELNTLPRWYYDSNEKKCLKFGYTGVGGNENNFISKELCTYICIDAIKEVELPKEETTTTTTTTKAPTSDDKKTDNGQNPPAGENNAAGGGAGGGAGAGGANNQQANQ